MAPWLPMGPCKACAVGFGSAMARLPVWGAKKKCIKKQREILCVGLWWLPLAATHNNQPIFGGGGRGDFGEEACGG